MGFRTAGRFIECVNELKRSVIKAIFPSLKEGRRADPINATLPHEIGAAGRSDSVPLRILTSPAVPWVKVARHFITTAQSPLFQGGETTSIPIRSHLDRPCLQDLKKDGSNDFK